MAQVRQNVGCLWFNGRLGGCWVVYDIVEVFSNLNECMLCWACTTGVLLPYEKCMGSVDRVMCCSPAALWSMIMVSSRDLLGS